MATVETPMPVSRLESLLHSLMGKRVAASYYWQDGSDEDGQLEEGARSELSIAFNRSPFLLSLLDPFFVGFSTTKPVVNLSPIFRGRRITKIITHPQERQSVELLLSSSRYPSTFIVAKEYRIIPIRAVHSLG